MDGLGCGATICPLCVYCETDTTAGDDESDDNPFSSIIECPVEFECGK